MRNVKLLIGFVGTQYEGWQSQKPSTSSGRRTTLQQTFEKVLAKIFKVKTNLISSSRTDSGVHAKGLVAHFRVVSVLPDAKIKAALNFHLPKDIVVFSAKTVKDDFHARYSAKSKIYQYEIWNSPTRPLFEAPFVLWYPHSLDIEKMREAAKPLVGRHDFSSFRDKGDDRGAVRHIKKLSIVRSGPTIRIRIEADGFLTHMVRIIVGTLIDVGRGKFAASEITVILRSKNRKHAGPTAKALGLTLLKVKY